MISASIIGGSGYAGSELLRLLLGHPETEIVKVTSRSHAGEPVGAVHPNLNKLTDLTFAEEDLQEIGEISDVVFVALPHGESMKRVPAIIEQARVVDLGGDFRIQDPAVFEEYYRLEHSAPELLAEAVYGLTEFNREAIRTAQLVACPGCFPTGALLALMPLALSGLTGMQVVVDSKTGSSGSGNTPTGGTHHPERAHDFRAYGIFTHRHRPEIVQELSAGAGQVVEAVFTPHSAPMVRGIFTTAYVFPPEPVSREQLHEVYTRHYAGEPFVRLVEQPRSAVVAGSNFCDLSFASDGRSVIVTTAIDNLVKGAAGQAVQNMNVMFDVPERTGLTFPGTHP